jgi:hypothetical protein
MRKIILLLSFVLFTLSGFAILSPTSVSDPNPVNGLNAITLQQFIKLSPKEYAALSGKKLNFLQRAELKISQKKIAKAIKKDASFKQIKLSAFDREPLSGAYWAGMLLGAFLGPVGVLIAYLINDDNKQERVRASWRGLIIFIGALAFAIAQMG